MNFYQSVASRLSEQLQINQRIISFESAPDDRLIVVTRCTCSIDYQFLVDRIPEVSQAIAELTPAKWWYLYPPGSTQPDQYLIAVTSQIPPGGEPDVTFMELEDRVHPILQPAIALAGSLNLSVFVIDYEGIYLGYYPRPWGKSIVDIRQQIGTKGMELLPPSLRGQCEYYFNLAIATGQPQTYIYNFTRDGEWQQSETTVKPYPEVRQVLVTIRRLQVVPVNGRRFVQSGEDFRLLDQ